VQAVVAPRSELIGRTLSKINFQRRYGASGVGLWRKDGWLDQEISKVRLRANDVLVLEGDRRIARERRKRPGVSHAGSFSRRSKPRGAPGRPD
jgi:K+/H+ antiporter YhaU regulatory subunit KhtT